MARIPEQELEISFVRSGGPGGQNVNKTSTKAQLRWNVGRSLVLNEDEKRMIREALANRLTNEDDIVLSVDDSRSQPQNRNRAVMLLEDLIHDALTPDAPRIPTKVPYSARRKRLQVKTRRSRVKQLRRAHPSEE